MMLAKIRLALVLCLFPILTGGAFLLRPDFLDAVALRQLALICGGYAVVLAIYAVFFNRSNRAVRSIAEAARESERRRAAERAEMQTRIDFLAAEREISMILNQDVEFETILDKVLHILHDAMGGGPDDEIEIYLRDGARRRAALVRGRVTFGRPGAQPPVVTTCLEDGRLIFSAENGRLEIVSPLSSDGERVGVVRVRAAMDGDPGAKSELAERLARHLEEFSGFLALAVKTPNLYLRAVEDGLTGLATKRHFLNLLEDAMESARRYGEPLSLIMADVDHFKKVNDTHGHVAGDRVLKGVSALIRRNTRKGGDSAGFRYGGEELGLLLPKTPLDKAEAVAERLRQQVEAKTFPGDIRVTISVGVSLYERGMDPDDMVKQADKALYEAKEGGRNRVVVQSRRCRSSNSSQK